MSTSAPAPAVAPAANFGVPHWGFAVLQLATRRRIALTTIVFAILLISDLILWQTRPSDLLDWTNGATVLGELLIVSGLLLRAWAAGTLYKLERIVACGPYRYVRNPLYIGSFLLMLGFSVLMRDWLAIWIVLGPVLAMYLNKIRQEEKYMTRLFPDDWPAYVQSTPRFVPNVSAGWPTLTGFSLRQWSRNHEYQALFATVAGLLLLFLWRRATA